jgi:hypothetical protein
LKHGLNLLTRARVSYQSTVSAKMSTDLKNIAAVVADLETRLAALKTLVGGGAAAAPAPAAKKQRKPRDPDAPKREPNEWIKFSMRVRALLKEREKTFELAKHLMSFTKHLKDTVGMSVDDAGILAARETWEPFADEEVEAHREAMREVARKALEEGADAEAAIEAYAKEHFGERTLPGAAAAAAEAASAASGGSGSGPKKPGRKPMTEEQKAAAKAEREAKLAAMSPAEKEALAAEKAAKKAARAAKKEE